MTGRYQTYPEYKNSGVRFFNYIPQHWSISKVRFISSFGRGLGITKANLKDTGVPCVSYGEVHSKYGFEIDPTKHSLKCVDEDYLRTSPYSLLSKGDFVFADTSEDIDGSGNFTQLVSDATLFAGYHTVVVRPTSDNYYRFLAYVFDSPEYRTQVRDAVKGVKVFSITQAILKNTNVWLPTYEEQQKIASFLDHEIAKIDILITKQEKLIALLIEKRQAVISHAVTRGLNPNATMKYSGVEWLGEVPESWSVWKLKHACSEIFLGLTSKVDYVDSGGVPLVRALNINGGILNLASAREISHEQHKKLTKYRCATRGDVLLSKSGTIGTAAIVDTDIEFSIYESIFSLRAIKKILLPEYLWFFIQSSVAKAQYARDSVGMGVHHLNMPDIQEVKVTIPPIPEQQELLIFIKNKLNKFDSLTAQASEMISLIKERKTALISAAVTGKIDVRNYNAEKAGN